MPVAVIGMCTPCYPSMTSHTAMRKIQRFRFVNTGKPMAECLAMLDELHRIRLVPMDETTKCCNLLDALPTEVADKCKMHRKGEWDNYAELSALLLQQQLRRQHCQAQQDCFQPQHGACCSAVPGARPWPAHVHCRPERRAAQPAHEGEGLRLQAAPPQCLVCGSEKHLCASCPRRADLFPEKFFYN